MRISHLFYNIIRIIVSAIITQEVRLKNTNIQLHIRREDLIHPFVSGNKFRKLKYNLIEAKNNNQKVLLTFGGAFSNHIAAVAFAGKEHGFHTIGIIRGEELADKAHQNPTLQFAKSCGMTLEFVSRTTYQLKNESSTIQKLHRKFGSFYLIPEGGTNALAIKGCEEILTADDSSYDYICCSVGTGGTITGIINSAAPNQKVLGFPALKGNFLKNEICNLACNNNWDLITDYHFGGYGKINQELISFINIFYKEYHIPLDPVYTGKMGFGIIDLIHKNFFPENATILMIHTGGLQGIAGMNIQLEKKKLPKIIIHD